MLEPYYKAVLAQWYNMKMTGDLSKVYPGQVDGKKHTADLMHVWQVEQAAVMLTKPGFFEWPILIEK